MTHTHYIQGAGGGGGKGGGGGNRTPTEAYDTLQSVQFANVLDLLSEGEIAGIEDPGGGTNSWHKSIFLDDTAVKNSSNEETILKNIILIVIKLSQLLPDIVIIKLIQYKLVTVLIIYN